MSWSAGLNSMEVFNRSWRAFRTASPEPASMSRRPDATLAKWSPSARPYSQEFTLRMGKAPAWSHMSSFTPIRGLPDLAHVDPEGGRERRFAKREARQGPG